MSAAEIGGTLFLWAVLLVIPGWLFWVFGGWPCVIVFAAFLGVVTIAGRASEWK